MHPHTDDGTDSVEDVGDSLDAIFVAREVVVWIVLVLVVGSIVKSYHEVEVLFYVLVGIERGRRKCEK